MVEEISNTYQRLNTEIYLFRRPRAAASSDGISACSNVCLCGGVSDLG